MKAKVFENEYWGKILQKKFVLETFIWEILRIKLNTSIPSSLPYLSEGGRPYTLYRLYPSLKECNHSLHCQPDTWTVEEKWLVKKEMVEKKMDAKKVAGNEEYYGTIYHFSWISKSYTPIRLLYSRITRMSTDSMTLSPSISVHSPDVWRRNFEISKSLFVCLHLDPSWRTWRRVKLLEKWYKIRIMKNVMYLLRFFFAISMEKKKMESGEVIWHENLDSNLKMKFNFRRE